MARTERKRWRPRLEVRSLGNEIGEYTLQAVRNKGEKAQCVCCRNPRRNKGSKKDQLTIQEKRNEWHDEEITEAQAQGC